MFHVRKLCKLSLASRTGQLHILLKRKSIQSVLQDPNTKEELKIKLQEVETFREYGIRELALNPSAGFKSFVPLDRKEIGWHVTACYPLKLESYTWWFPIAGTVPYKGYFDLDKAKEEEKTQRKRIGYCTELPRVTPL